MLTTKQLQDEIIRLKKEKNVCVLAHAYQSHDITEVADFVGDSFGLSVEAAKTDYESVIMCGVRFMAETVKILSPEKKVFLASSQAGCPMANQFSKNDVLKLKEQYPDYTVVAYVNTTSELKTVCDVCVTSSSAVKIVRNIKNKNILFIPDCNLGAWVKEQVSEKNIVLVNGGCPVHRSVNLDDVKKAKALHPKAKLLVHPECIKEVSNESDYAGSTTGIMKYAKESDADEFIIGTETAIVSHLQFECPNKKFYPLSPELVCSNMKITTLYDIYNILSSQSGEEIILSDEVMTKAKACLDNMISLG